MTDKERRETFTDFVSGKPSKSGNYVVLYDGKIYTDDYTTSSGGHWWNVGTNGGRDGVLYSPSSFKQLGS